MEDAEAKWKKLSWILVSHARELCGEAALYDSLKNAYMCLTSEQHLDAYHMDMLTRGNCNTKERTLILGS